jgi:hypothetical protein
LNCNNAKNPRHWLIGLVMLTFRDKSTKGPQ